jgi:hypothetical protein
MRSSLRRRALVASIRRDGGVPFPVLTPRQWQVVADEAIALGVGGQLHHALDSLEPRPAAPPEIRERLRAHYYGVGARNAKLLSTLGEVLDALAARGIPCIVLKGAALLEGTYADFGARPMDDVDLLVHEEDLDRTANALADSGFVADEWFRPAEWYRATLHHLVPMARDGVTVEVHHALLPPVHPQAVPTSDLWTHAIPVMIAGRSTLMLSATHHLLHLVQHVSVSHRFVGGLPRLVDIARWIVSAEGGIDWVVFVDGSRGVERESFLALRLAVELADAAVPESCLARLRSEGRIRAAEEPLQRALGRRLVLGVGDRGIVPDWLTQLLLAQLLARRSWTARVRGVLRGIVVHWRDAGRSRGWHLFAIPYGMFVAPWRRIGQRAVQRRQA